MKLEIREATPDDADNLAMLCKDIQALHAGMYPALFCEPTHDELAVFFRARMTDPNFTAFLALDQGEPVGYVALNIVRRPPHILIRAREAVEIDHIHVNKTHRKQGIGRRLAAMALEVASSYGIATVQLSVWARNTLAVAAFSALGFEPQRHIMVLRNREMPEKEDEDGCW